MALDGSTEGWLSIGFEPIEWMKNAGTGILLSSYQVEGQRGLSECALAEFLQGVITCIQKTEVMIRAET